MAVWRRLQQAALFACSSAVLWLVTVIAAGCGLVASVGRLWGGGLNLMREGPDSVAEVRRSEYLRHIGCSSELPAHFATSSTAAPAAAAAAAQPTNLCSCIHAIVSRTSIPCCLYDCCSPSWLACLRLLLVPFTIVVCTLRASTLRSIPRLSYRSPHSLKSVSHSHSQLHRASIDSVESVASSSLPAAAAAGCSPSSYPLLLHPSRRSVRPLLCLCCWHGATLRCAWIGVAECSVGMGTVALAC